ncbi:hypothetical protein Hanom_Chr13g01204711 [Helianthus anomalus]
MHASVVYQKYTDNFLSIISCTMLHCSSNLLKLLSFTLLSSSSTYITEASTSITISTEGSQTAASKSLNSDSKPGLVTTCIISSRDGDFR